jgi:hypothetical protein
MDGRVAEIQYDRKSDDLAANLEGVREAAWGHHARLGDWPDRLNQFSADRAERRLTYL